MTVRLDDVPGFQRDAAGSAVLTGPALSLFRRIDGDLAALDVALGAEPMALPSLLPVEELKRIDYFTSFPHLVCFPTSPRDEEVVLEAFRRANGPTSESASIALGPISDVRTVLAPAACYGVYPALRDRPLRRGGKIYDVRSTCFRREKETTPLRRQATFTMREAVYAGDLEGARAHLERARERVLALADHYGLRVSVEAATDPFFDPARSARYAHQKLFPTKFEFKVGDLAIGSLNLHRNYFGEAFRITHEGAPASTACVAYGIERWLAVVLDAHGTDPANWPTGATA